MRITFIDICNFQVDLWKMEYVIYAPVRFEYSCKIITMQLARSNNSIQLARSNNGIQQARSNRYTYTASSTQ